MERAMFDLIGGSKANNKSDNFRDGKGRVLILENIYQNMNEGATFVGKFQVVASEAKGDLELQPFQPGKPHIPVDPARVVVPNAVGSQVSWSQKVQKFKSAAGNVKAYILNVLGFSEAEVTGPAFAETMQQIVNNDPKQFGGRVQPARGMLVDFNTYRQMTKTGANAGSMNSYVNFVTVPIGNDPNDPNSNHPVQIAKRRAELDKTNPLT